MKNTSHNPSETKDGQGKITIYCKETKFEHLDEGYGDDVLKRLDENNFYYSC